MVEVHACVSYWEDEHVVHGVHTRFVDVEHEVVSYCPEVHVVHGVHTRSEVAPQACD